MRPDRREPHFLRRRHLFARAGTRVMPRLRRCPTRFISRGCATHRGSALHEPPTATRLAHMLGRPVVDSRSARDSSLPGDVPGRIPSRPRQRMRSPVEASCPHERPAFEMGQTRPRFRRGFRARHHPWARRRARHCLAARSPDRSRLLLAGHSRSAAFEARGRPLLAPVTTPAAAGLPGLVMDVPRSVPSLAGVTPRAPHRMSRAPARA